MSSVPKKEEKDAGKAAEQPVWEWENDGHWVPYADEYVPLGVFCRDEPFGYAHVLDVLALHSVQGELETAYASKDKADVTIGGKYLVSVSALYQLNVQTMFQRQVRVVRVRCGCGVVWWTVDACTRRTHALRVRCGPVALLCGLRAQPVHAGATPFVVLTPADRPPPGAPARGPR